MRFKIIAALCFALASVSGSGHLFAQAVIAQPYSAQLRSDPAVGNVQGIQRYGRPLRTDPDQGEGYSYHVFPSSGQETVVASGSGQTNAAATKAAVDLFGKMQRLQVELRDQNQQLLDTQSKLAVVRQSSSEAPDAERERRNKQRSLEADVTQLQTAKAANSEKMKVYEQALNALLQGSAQTGGTQVVQSSFQSVGPATPFNATAGLRNFPRDAGLAPGSPFAGEQSETQAAMQSIAVGPRQTGTGKDGTPQELQIFHQPLVQIKVRVVEVTRNDSLQVSSVLDYVSRENGLNSLISGNNVNQDHRNLSGGSRFTQDNLITFPTEATGQSLANLAGPGALVNLTSEHINYIARFLATELHGDVVTAPQVVTLNGQNVEFVAGEKLPFQLGQNVIQGNNNNIQQFFYKHVGTYISVTPRIVDWGLHGEGRGNASISASEITQWNLLVKWMEEQQLLDQGQNIAAKNLTPYLDSERPIPIEIKTLLLKRLNQYTRDQLYALPKGNTPWPFLPPDECAECEWSPERCTIDLSIVVRLSDGSTTSIDTADETGTTSVNVESDVRALANIIQVKSGHGVVMAGLIGEREVEDTAKVPVLGDIPVVGFLFRSKGTSRQKTEVVIFVEAQVLDRCPDVARAQSHDDFLLSQPFVEGELLDSPLEYGMYRAGFGSYLPPATHNEAVFWERQGRKIRKIATHVDDALE